MLTLAWYFLFNIARASYYTDENATDIFDVFKEKYNKAYKSAAEEKTRLKAFVKNLNIVDELNEVTKDRKTFFILNQYADLDPREIEEHYAVNVKPYDNVSVQGNQEDQNLEKQRENELYDLGNAAKLYENYMSSYNKEKHKKKFNYTIHFYRFVKTLAERNKNIHQGIENRPLDETADVLKEPYEYFF